MQINWSGMSSLDVHPLEIFLRGTMFLRRNMRKEMVTEAELLSHLRQEGIEDPSKVKTARIESDGQFSVVT